MFENFKKWTPLAFPLVIIFLVSCLVWRYPGWFFVNGVTVLGWACFILQWLYSHWDRFYWEIQKIKYNISNPDTQWELYIRYQISGDINNETLRVIQDNLCKAAAIDRPTIIPLSSHRVQIKADELNIEVSFDYESNDIDVLFTKIPVSFRGSKRVIEKRIVPILESIENKMGILKKSYWLTVYFGNVNPYFGLYIRRIRQENVSEMHIRIGSNKENIDVSKQKITLTASSLGGLSENARKYLTLSELPA